MSSLLKELTESAGAFAFGYEWKVELKELREKHRVLTSCGRDQGRGLMLLLRSQLPHNSPQHAGKDQRVHGE